MKKAVIVISVVLIFLIGSLSGFFISQEYFPKFDYGYTKEGGNKIVTRVENPQQPSTYKVSKTVKGPEKILINGVSTERLLAEVSVIVEEIPNKDSKYLKKGIVSINVPGYSSWEVWSDEGSIGAGDQAPCPLDYLTLGSAFCLASHLRLAAEGNDLDPGILKVEMRSYYGQYGDFGKEGTYGTTENSKISILLNSPLPKEKLLQIVRIAQNNCYAAEGFRNKTPIETTLFINGKEVK